LGNGLTPLSCENEDRGHENDTAASCSLTLPGLAGISKVKIGVLTVEAGARVAP